MLDLSGKTAIVTGAAQGMGVGIAKVLAGAGATVFITDVSVATGIKTAENLSRETGRETRFLEHDVTSVQSCLDVAHAVRAATGRIDILVNNAGVSRRVPFLELDEREWDRVFDVCSKGVFLMSKAVVPAMIQQGGGRIVHIASLCSKIGFPNFAHYSAAKASVLGLMHSMAQELAQYEINVNAVMPGVVRTPLWDEGLLPDMVAHDSAETPEAAWAAVLEPIPLKRPQTPEDIGEAVAFLASDAARNITGEAISVTGGQLLG
jgi:meso-butanediol dehydrogenase/(S,S)-butanediol dehydrogenase/diacetyl reductase